MCPGGEIGRRNGAEIAISPAVGAGMCPGGEIGRRNGLKIKPKALGKVVHG
jgi:hypothetical protein